MTLIIGEWTVSMRISGAGFLLSLIAVAVMVAASVYAWTQLPGTESFPVHWNAQGEADRFAGPWIALGTMPALTLLVSLIFTAIPAVEPRQENLSRSSFAYKFIWGLIVGTLMLIHFGYLSELVYERFDLTAARGAVLGVLFMALGYVLPRVRSNFFIGVRTPWTLSSETVWEKTHRAAGIVVFLFGLTVFMTAFAAPRYLWSRIFLFGALTMAVLLVLWSLVLWLRERHSQG